MACHNDPNQTKHIYGIYSITYNFVSPLFPPKISSRAHYYAYSSSACVMFLTCEKLKLSINMLTTTTDYQHDIQLQREQQLCLAEIWTRIRYVLHRSTVYMLYSYSTYSMLFCPVSSTMLFYSPFAPHTCTCYTYHTAHVICMLAGLATSHVSAFSDTPHIYRC